MYVLTCSPRELSADDSRETLGVLRLNCMRRFSDFGPRNDERDDLDGHWWLDSPPEDNRGSFFSQGHMAHRYLSDYQSGTSYV